MLRVLSNLTHTIRPDATNQHWRRYTMGHWGTCPLDFQLFNFSGHSRTNSDIRLHVVAYPVKITLLVSCLLAPNPGDATANQSIEWTRRMSNCGCTHRMLKVTTNLQQKFRTLFEVPKASRGGVWVSPSQPTRGSGRVLSPLRGVEPDRKWIWSILSSKEHI